ncbi:MAG: FtsX-like permease family protein [Bacteroidales bacterium]|nr:FtsX-like permease family protein [Bacteroidales bacterium]
MFQYNLKLAWRNLLKSKYTSAINLTGLVVGMTAALLLWQYVAFEKSYDTFFENADRIVRVRTDRVKDGAVSMQFAAGAAVAGPFLQQNFPEVQDYAKIHMGGDGIFAKGERKFREQEAVFATANFFKFFTHPLLSGDVDNCLKEPFMACISESVAKKYFGTENPIGQSLKRNDRDDYKITGVFADWPENSHMKPEILLSYITYSEVYNTDGETETAFFWDGFYTYLLLKPGTDVKALEAKITPMIAQKAEADVDKKVVFALQPLKEIHLNSHHLSEFEANGAAVAVRALLIIGILVLLIAWFNYVNLSTARSETRSREVGVRKVIGSSRSELVRQFMLEASLLNVMAIGISLALAQILLPAFEQLAGKQIPFTLFSEPSLWAAIVGVFLLGTLLVGLYPALVLSSFRPSEALGSSSSRGTGGGNAWLRKGLVVAQFATSVILIVGTVVIFRQLSHLRNANLGININQTLVVKAPMVVDSTLKANISIFKNEISQLTAIQGITASTGVPGQQAGWTAGIRPWGGDDNSYESLEAIGFDFDFAAQYGLEAATGRLLSEKMTSDSGACLLNEAGVKRLKLGSSEEAIGKELDFWGDKLTVVGVVKNFHQQSPKLAYEPLIFRISPRYATPDFFSIKTNAKDIGGTLSAIEAKYAAAFGGNPFDYFFLDEHFAKQFEEDKRLGRLTALFAGLAIFVSCLGLFALAAFVAERRTKEIGIRKVLGASVNSLVGLLSKEFIMLVGIAIVIATPLAWYAMNAWLQNFEMRIDLEWWMFAVAGLAAVVIAFLTMSFQSVKAALANPVKSLRSE